MDNNYKLECRWSDESVWWPGLHAHSTDRLFQWYFSTVTVLSGSVWVSPFFAGLSHHFISFWCTRYLYSYLVILYFENLQSKIPCKLLSKTNPISFMVDRGMQSIHCYLFYFGTFSFISFIICDLMDQNFRDNVNSNLYGLVCIHIVLHGNDQNLIASIRTLHHTFSVWRPKIKESHCSLLTLPKTEKITQRCVRAQESPQFACLKYYSWDACHFWTSITFFLMSFFI